MFNGRVDRAAQPMGNACHLPLASPGVGLDGLNASGFERVDALLGCGHQRAERLLQIGLCSGEQIVASGLHQGQFVLPRLLIGRCQRLEVAQAIPVLGRELVAAPGTFSQLCQLLVRVAHALAPAALVPVCKTVRKGAGENGCFQIAQQRGHLGIAQLFACDGKLFNFVLGAARQAGAHVLFRFGERGAVEPVIGNRTIELPGHQHHALDTLGRQLLGQQVHIRLVQKLTAARQEEHHIAAGHVVPCFLRAAGHRVVHAWGVDDLEPLQFRQRQQNLSGLDQCGEATIFPNVVVELAHQLIHAADREHLFLPTGKQGGRINAVVLHHRHEILGHASARAVAAPFRVVLNLLPLLRAVVMHGQVRVFTIGNTGQVGRFGRGGLGKDGFTVEQQCIEEAALAGFDLAHDADAQVLLICFDAFQFT